MLAQILAVTIFLVMFIMIITEKIERHYVTLGCGLATLIFVFGIAMKDLHAIWEQQAKVPVALTGRPLFLSQV